MPDQRTLVSELGTAWGMIAPGDPGDPPGVPRPGENGPIEVDPGVWDRVCQLASDPTLAPLFRRAVDNGRAFRDAPAGLRGRPPLLIEWTGGRRPAGDEVAPIDLRVDHVYLISCKYRSKVLLNASPARVFDGLGRTAGDWERTDWYDVAAPSEHSALFRAACEWAGLGDLGGVPRECCTADRVRLRDALSGRRWPPELEPFYARLCTVVSEFSAERWRRSIGTRGEGEALLWRMLRIGNAPYFLLGHDGAGPVRRRVATTWDWRRRWRFVGLDVIVGDSGQPEVGWCALLDDRVQGGQVRVEGRVEIRWSHGRFRQPPEAKVYASTPVADLPGYEPLDSAGATAAPPSPGAPGGVDGAPPGRLF